MIEPEGASNDDAPEPEELTLAMREPVHPPAVHRVDSLVPDTDVEALEVGRRVLAKKKTLAEKLTYLPDTHRLLPQAPDAERGVLSSFLLSPREVGGMCVEKRITTEHFSIPAHADIYRVLLDLWERNQAIDFISLTQILRDRSMIDQCGGAAFITELFTFLPTAANAAYYVEILLEKETLRQIIKTGTEYAARGYDEQDDVPGLLNTYEQKVFAISNVRTMSKVANMKQEVVAAIGHIEELYSRRGEIGGIATGFADFDMMTDGLHPGEMIVLAARPSIGKTALAMNMAEHMALDRKMAVGVFSLEMTTQQLVQRLLCSRARVNLGRIRDGYLSDRDFPALQTAASKLAETKIFIDDSSDLTIQEIRAKARRMVQQHGCKAFFVDYLQLIRSLSKQALNNREREISEVSAGLKAMAKELGVPVVVLAQMSRDYEKRGAFSRPRLSDLRESGAIEQDSDLVGFIVRDEMHPDLTAEQKKAVEGEAEIIIAKQRHGPVGDVHLTFLKEFTRFETRATQRDREEDDAQPGLAID